MAKTHLAYLSLGGNIENREGFLNEAVQLLNEKAGEILKKSSYYETESWGFDAVTPFLNSVVLLKTELSPQKLLNTIQDIEKTLGREKKGRPYASRKIDIDILYIDEKIKIFESLKSEVLYNKWNALLSRIEARLKEYPISEEEVQREIEDAREEFAARRC